MATISKQTIIGNGFTVGLNVPSALGLDDGADGSYIIAANQIAWGNNSIFNGKKFGNTTQQLLAAIEDAITDVASKVQTSSPTGTSTSGPTLTFTNFDATLQWGKSVTLAGINDNDITVKLPANPNTDTKVTSVDNHYVAKQITTEGLYKIKTDAAGHIISATSFNDFIEKSKINELKQDITNFKAYILGLSSSTTSSSSTTTSSSTTSSSTTPKPSGDSSVTPTVTPTGDSSATPTPKPSGDSSVTPEPDTTTPTTTPNDTVTVTVTNPDSVTGTPEPDTTTTAEPDTTTPTTTSSTATVTVTNPDSVTGTPEPDTTTPTTTEPVTTPTTTAEDEVTTPTTTEEVTTPTTPMTTEVSTEEPVTETPITSVTTGK